MKKKYVECIFIVVIVVTCLFYLKTKTTYTSYASSADGEVDSKVAGWNIKINDELVSTGTEKNVGISDIVWTGEHVAEGKAAPGSTGVMTMVIDPTGTDVAIRYDLEIIDKAIDPNIVLRVTNITEHGVNLVKTGVSSYTGIITLDMLATGIKPSLILDVAWENDDNVNDLDKDIESIEDYLLIKFRASQYRGEEIVEYIE